jgi:hypothetical protein
MLLDEQYLQDLGVNDLPEDAKKEIVAGLEQTVQDAISVRVVEKLPDALIDEFNSLTDGSIEEVKAWLTKVSPYYATAPEFLENKEKSGTDEEDFTRQYALIKWLAMNVPDYNQIVLEVLANTKGELLALKEQLLNK